MKNEMQMLAAFKKAAAVVQHNNESVVGGATFCNQWFGWLYSFDGERVDLYSLVVETEYGVSPLAEVTENFTSGFSQNFIVDFINYKLLFDKFKVDIRTATGTYNDNDTEVYMLDGISIYTKTVDGMYVLYEIGDFDNIGEFQYCRTVVNDLADVVLNI